MNDTEFLSFLRDRLEVSADVSGECVTAIAAEAARQSRRRLFRRRFGAPLAAAAALVIVAAGFLVSGGRVSSGAVPVEAVLAFYGATGECDDVLRDNAADSVLAWQDAPYAALCEDVEEESVGL